MSEQTTETPDAPPAPPADAPPPADVDWKAEADKWKTHSRKHEQLWKDAKPAVDELEKLKAAQMSDMDKAVREAEERGRSDAAKTYGEKIAAAKLEAALTGVVPDPSSVVEDLNLSRYVTDTGDVNAEAVTALRDKYAAIAPPRDDPPNLHQGRQGSTPPGQLSRSDLKSMSPEQIQAARDDGRLTSLLGATN